MLLTSNRQKYFNPSKLQSNLSIPELAKLLKELKCNGCELGLNSKLIGPVVYRGNPEAKIMIVGEGPGAQEEKQGVPFVGAAGQLLDKIFASIGIDTNRDCYITNAVLCRPIAPRSTGKQNLTPSENHYGTCKVYLQHQINLINPKIIVITGLTAVKTLLPKLTKEKPTMVDLVGKVLLSDEFPNQKFFVIYHPAHLIYAQKDNNKYQYLRKTMWEHMQILQKVIKELEVEC